MLFFARDRAVGAFACLGVLTGCALAAPGLAFAAERLPAETRHALDHVALKSNAVLVIDEDTGETLAAKNADAVAPVASLTKLMTALVVLEAGQPLDEPLRLTTDDVDRIKRTPSRLRIGARLRRDDLLLLTLMASENRAALALGRAYPGGRAAFVERMNAKARELGMHDTRFADPAGLSSRNVSSARDLHVLMKAADAHPLIRDYTTRRGHRVRVGKQTVSYVNSNRLVRRPNWDIELQKTGYTDEAGRCLVMRAKVGDRQLAMIFLNSLGKLTRYGDASRVRMGLEQVERQRGRTAPMTAAP